MLHRAYNPADPLGTQTETEVDRPEDDGEPRRYRETVRRRRRFPVDPRTVAAKLTGHVLRRKPTLVRWLDQRFTSSPDDISMDDLAGAIEAGHIDESWLVKWRERYAKHVVQHVVPEWQRGQRAGADVMIPGLEGFLDSSTNFASLNERFDAWTRSRAASLVVGLADSQRDALNAMITQFAVYDRRNPREVARMIRPLVGVTPRDAASLAARARKMREAGSSEIEIRRTLGNERLTRIRRRAETIAETELAYAYNFGQWHAMREAEADGAFEGEVIVKRWFAQADERVCPFCGPLHDTVIGMEATFPGATRQVPNTFCPPAHPRCRCVLLYELEPAEARPGTETPDGLVVDEPPADSLPSRDPIGGDHKLKEDEVWSVIDDERAQIDSFLRGIDPSRIDSIRAELFAGPPPGMKLDEWSKRARELVGEAQAENAKAGSFATLERMRELRDALITGNTPRSHFAADEASIRASCTNPDEVLAWLPEMQRTYQRALGGARDGVPLRFISDQRIGARQYYLSGVEQRIDRARLVAELSGDDPLRNVTRDNALRLLEDGVPGQDGDGSTMVPRGPWADVLEDEKRRLREAGRYVLPDLDGDENGNVWARDVLDALAQADDRRIADALLSTIDRIHDTELAHWSKGSPAVEKVRRAVINGANERMTQRILWHENAHHVQHSNRRVSDAEREFLRRRWRDPDGSTPEPRKLSEIEGNDAYEDHEVSIPDKFRNAYIGKVYPNREDRPSSEVFPMGVQEFIDPQKMLDLWRDDPEHFALTVAILRGRFGWRPDPET